MKKNSSLFILIIFLSLTLGFLIGSNKNFLTNNSYFSKNNLSKFNLLINYLSNNYVDQIENFDQESISDSLDLLKMLDRGSKMSQILLECGNDVKLLNLNGDIIDFEITSSEITMHSAIKEISKREYPLILKNKNGKFGILTNHDFDSDSAIRELSKLVQNGNK